MRKSSKYVPFYPVALLLWASFYACLAHSANEALLVKDQEGKPLPNVVVLALAAGTLNLPATETYIVDQVNVEFVPHVLVVPPGAAVVFPNSDKTRHQVYSFSAPNNFELKLYREQDAPPVVFQSPGVVELGCNIHDAMKGYIYVSDAAVNGVTDADGRVTLALPSGVVELSLWHPLLGSKPAVTYTYEKSSLGNVLVLPVTQAAVTEAPSSLKHRLQKFKKSND